MKNKAIALIASISIVSVLSACVSAGNANIAQESSQTVAARIIKGQTTKAQVRTLYGAPNATTSMMDGGEVWVYTFTHAQPTAATYIPIVGAFAGGATGESKSISITFDENGVVKSFSVTSSEIKSGFGATAR